MPAAASAEQPVGDPAADRHLGPPGLSDQHGFDDRHVDEHFQDQKHEHHHHRSQVDEDFDDEPAALEDNPIWQQENVTLRSVGIDIGSSGTQVVFSRLRLRRDGAGLATRFVVIERSVLFESEVAFTPFAPDGRIDAHSLGTIIDQAYGAAGQEPSEVDTGVVILTGEALRRTNAERIASVVADTAGDFVCAAAGHHMEACLAAHGSGAVQRSADTGRTLLNIDIGGGTTKLSVISNGTITDTAALHTGGRLLATDADGRIVRLEPAGAELASRAGIGVQLGDPVSSTSLDAIAAHMAQIVARAVSAHLPEDLAQHGALQDLPYLTDPIGNLAEVDGVIFSGGVGEYVYGTETRDFGDLGRRFGRALAGLLETGAIPFPLEPASARIRATALGASEFCVQLSGTTCFVPDPEALLPRRNLPVIRPRYCLPADIDVEDLAGTIATQVAKATVDELASDVVLALQWSGELSYQRLHQFAAAVAEALGDRSELGHPVILAVEADIGRNLGSMLRDEIGVRSDVLVLDGLRLQDFDYIDLGLPIAPSGVVPVTVKSLVFAEPARRQ